MDEKKSRFEYDMEVEWKHSQCKYCKYNDKEDYELCNKLGLKPQDYKWNRVECPVKKVENN